MGVELAGVRVEAVELGVIDARLQPCLDKRGDRLKPLGQAVFFGIAARAAGAAEEVLETIAGDVGGGHRTADKLGERIRALVLPLHQRAEQAALSCGGGRGRHTEALVDLLRSRE